VPPFQSETTCETIVKRSTQKCPFCRDNSAVFSRNDSETLPENILLLKYVLRPFRFMLFPKGGHVKRLYPERVTEALL
jgi:hypothetical protein